MDLRQAASERVSLERMRRRFTQHLALLHLNEAWHVALQLKMPEVWAALCEAALTHMEVRASEIHTPFAVCLGEACV